MTTTLFAKTSDQGTACEEAVLCAEHDSPENRAMLEKRAWKDATGPWLDATENEAIACCICGATQQAQAVVGSRVRFHRGMFGEWEGRVARFYLSRGRGTCGFDCGQRFAVVTFRLANGKRGEARVRADSLTVLP